MGRRRVVKKWKTLAVKTVYATPWLTLRLETCELAPGKVVTDYHVTHYYYNVRFYGNLARRWEGRVP